MADSFCFRPTLGLATCVFFLVSTLTPSPPPFTQSIRPSHGAFTVRKPFSFSREVISLASRGYPRGDKGASKGGKSSREGRSGGKEERSVDDSGEEMSRRAKLKAVPVDPKIIEKIKRQRICNPARGPTNPPRPKKREGGGRRGGSGQKGSTRFQRVGGEETKKGPDEKFSLLSRYSGYGELDEESKNFLGRRAKSKIRFVLSAHTPSQIPQLDIPEIAFAGRSNVGKSSLLNAIGLTTIVRSSNTPGLTQSLNFYRLREEMSLVDLPGYGFAYAKDSKIESWANLSQHYFQTRPNLRRIFVVLDARHGSLDRDEEFLRKLSTYRNAEFQVILNKADLVVKPEDLARQYERVRELVSTLPGGVDTIHMVSARTGAGIRDLMQEIRSFV
ncbi:hypothetical protein AAMO2058_000117000 [Amorphochlora amoebiformis]